MWPIRTPFHSSNGDGWIEFFKQSRDECGYRSEGNPILVVGVRDGIKFESHWNDVKSMEAVYQFYTFYLDPQDPHPFPKFRIKFFMENLDVISILEPDGCTFTGTDFMFFSLNENIV